ncbi:hypothetical protein Fmac_019685 [Flemingia macrophylla]|uniref:Uncharacterized protein n=1 Tax=Flemingia macrophylla TaxID=520843 RepID=A0ABD1M8N0_9FABA
MEGPSCSRFNYHEKYDELRQKLLATTRELENMKSVQKELLNLLKMAYEERDEAKEEIQKLVKSFTSNNLVPNNSVMIPQATKAHSSITESNSPSHDSLLEAVSPLEFPNVVDSHNVCYPLVHDTRVSPQNPTCDVGSQVLECMAKGKALPQKGKLLKAVMDAGPLLKTLLVAGPLPTWRNPPPAHAIAVPPLKVHHFGSSDSFNPLHSVTLVNSNASFQLNSNASCKKHAPSRFQQSHQCFLSN